MTYHTETLMVHFNMNLKQLSEEDSPVVGSKWKKFNSKERHELVNNELILNRFNEFLEIIDLKDDGQIILNFKVEVLAGIRGQMLLNFEKIIKKNVDKGLVIWLQPLGDKSSLRRLRGIEVKS
jgi:hypothetical protein